MEKVQAQVGAKKPGDMEREEATGETAPNAKKPAEPTSECCGEGREPEHLNVDRKGQTKGKYGPRGRWLKGFPNGKETG